MFDFPEGTEDFDRVTFNRLRIGGKLMDFTNPDEVEFVQFAVQGGVSASISIPADSALVRDAVTSYRDHLSKLAKHIEELASSRTQDRKLKQENYRSTATEAGTTLFAGR